MLEDTHSLSTILLGGLDHEIEPRFWPINALGEGSRGGGRCDAMPRLLRQVSGWDAVFLEQCPPFAAKISWIE